MTTDVCQLLKETRLSRGLSLEEVAQRTYIKLYYLEALEEGWLDKLPAPVHTFGYVRLYAKLLGLDGGALVAQFQQQRGLNLRSGSGKLELAAPTGGEWTTSLSPQRASNGHMDAANATYANGHGSGRGVSLSQLIAGGPRQEAPARQEPIVMESPDVRQAQAQAQQVLSQAERDAQQLVRGAEAYADEVLAALEVEVARALDTIRNGRQFLQLRRQGGPSGL